MQRILPYLWFNNNAEEAIEFYTGLFPNSSITNKKYFNKEGAQIASKSEGDLMSCAFTLAGQAFGSINGSGEFTFTPATSFTIACETEEELRTYWNALSEGGMIMMPLQKYPFSTLYGWCSDRFGISWQCNLLPGAKQKITPSFLFVGSQHGKAEEAMNLYTSLLPDSKIGTIARYEEADGDTVGTIKYGDFTIHGQQFIAMDSGFAHQFAFSQAISFLIECDTQAEIDTYWDVLKQDGQVQQCGWLLDRFGIAWQIAPANLEELLQNPDPAKAEKVMHTMLGMVKLDIAKLEEAAQ